jgi:hypothetical protein
VAGDGDKDFQLAQGVFISKIEELYQYNPFYRFTALQSCHQVHSSRPDHEQTEHPDRHRCPSLERSLFSFKVTRDAGLRFENGQFVMIGLEVEGRP